jgi:rubrerythrin
MQSLWPYRYSGLEANSIGRRFIKEILKSNLYKPGFKKEAEQMAVWKCNSCGYEKEGRCKPKKCDCGAKESFQKKE